MRPSRFIPLALLVSFIPGCDVEPIPISPFVDDWQTEETIQLPFTTDGGYDVSTLRIGGTAVEENFFNRGDVVVVYDADPGEMTIEARRFAHARDEDGANDIFGRLQLWLSDGDFAHPSQVPDLGESGCYVGMWRDGCGIRTWYDGLIQPQQSGMDLRVHLPADFLANVIVTTEDNILADDYRNRGNVCLWDAPASATIELASGQALVKMAGDLKATPTCADEDFAACEAADWASDCPCRLQGHAPSVVKVLGATADVAVSLPSSAFANLIAENQQGEPTPGDHCFARIDVPGADLDEGSFDWKQTGVNGPRGAIAAAMSVSAFSKKCDPVHFVESPEVFSRGSEGPLDPRRGDITICDGCIQNTSCDDFLEDGLRLSNQR